MISVVYVFVYEFHIGSYIFTLIIIKSQERRVSYVVRGVESPSLRVLPWSKMVNELALCVIAWVSKLFLHNKYITSIV